MVDFAFIDKVRIPVFESMFDLYRRFKKLKTISPEEFIKVCYKYHIDYDEKKRLYQELLIGYIWLYKSTDSIKYQKKLKILLSVPDCYQDRLKRHDVVNLDSSDFINILKLREK